MKKLIAMILTLALMLPAAAMACPETDAQTAAVMVAKKEATYTYSDYSYWALTDTCTLAGIKDVDEAVPHWPVQNFSGQYVAGWTKNGWTREAGAIRTVTVNGQTIGLTLLKNVTVTIYAEYAEIARMVVENLLGEGTELSANSIAACAMWWDGDWVSMIFHPSYSDRFVVGYVTFNCGEEVTPLYLAHFGEELRFGLACGWWIPEPVKEPEPAQETAQASATASASASAAVSVSASGNINQSGDGCWRNNTFVQINLFSFVRQCARWMMGGACEE